MFLRCLSNLVRPPLAGALTLALLAGCQSAGSGGNAFEAQTAWRVRADVGAELNEDEGWAARVNTPVTLPVETPFRIRFEIESRAANTDDRWYELQFQRNDGEWQRVPAAAFPYAEATELTPRVSVIQTLAFPHGFPTANLLRGSGAPFESGAGVNFSEATRVMAGSDFHTEWEWPLVIRRFVDGAATNNEGDRFAFRMIDGTTGAPVPGDTPRVTATVPAGLLGGTFVETPGRLGPWQASNGGLYFLMEPAESFNVLMAMKSSDGGHTWQEADPRNRPVTGDLEGLASAYVDNTVHILHQITDKVVYHSFRTADHQTAPDTWQTRDELVALPGEPPVQVTALEARSDGSLVASFGGPQQVLVSFRSPDGQWSEPMDLDPDATATTSGPQSVRGEDDVVHLAWTDREGHAWYRPLMADNSLGPRVKVASGLGTAESDVGSVLPLVHLPATDTVVIVYRLDTGQLWERRIGSAGELSAPVQVTTRAVVQNAVDSDQTGADAVGDGERVHVLFIEAGTGRLFHTHSGPDGRWQAALLEQDDVDAQWVRGQVLKRGDGRHVYGYVFDAGSDGGSGLNRYAEVLLSSP